MAIGAGAGLMVRGLYAWLRRDLALSAVNLNRMRHRTGSVLMRDGDPVRTACIIQSGDVKVTRTVDGQERSLGALGPGDVFGLLGVIHDASQYATITTQRPVTLYRLSLDELFATSGGAGHPVASVLQAAARLVRTLADRCTDPASIA